MRPALALGLKLPVAQKIRGLQNGFQRIAQIVRQYAQARHVFLHLCFSLQFCLWLEPALARHRIHLTVKNFSLDVLCENCESRNLFDTQFPPCKNRGRGIFLQGGLGRRTTQSLAEVAELADAHGSGPCTRKGVGVRVPSSAPDPLAITGNPSDISVPPVALKR